MESYNQCTNGSSLNDTSTETEQLFSTYLCTVIIVTLTSAIIVITPAVTIINVIWQSRELHTKYFFFVAHLLTTSVTLVIAVNVLTYAVMLIYLLGMDSDSAVIVLKWLGIAPFLLLYLMNVLSPIPVTTERMITIAFPYRHKSIMTNKTVAGVLAAMWGISAILTIIINVIIPFDVVWSLALVRWHPTIHVVVAVPRLTSIVCIVAANSFLQYKITISNRKAEENQRLGNEEEVKKIKKLLHEVRAQAKATITLFIVGGIDVIANILQTVTYLVIEASAESSNKMYLLLFSYYIIETCFLLSRILVHGFYMKKIRNRLPNWMTCYRQWIIRHNRVGILHQQP